MTRTSDTVRTHLQRCRTLGEGLLKLCAHQIPYTGRTHRLFPSPQAASVRPRFEPAATPPSRATSRGCYRYANPPPLVALPCRLTLSRPRNTEYFEWEKTSATVQLRRSKPQSKQFTINLYSNVPIVVCRRGGY